MHFKAVFKEMFIFALENIHKIIIGMKKIVLFALCIVMAFGVSAQMVSKKFVQMKDVDMFRRNALLLENNEDQFVEYLYPRVGGKKMVEHTLAVFNKNKRSFNYHKVVFSTPHFLETAFDMGEEYFASYTYVEKKSTVYCTGKLPKAGTQNARTKNRLTIPTKAVWSTHVESPDGKLHAVILLAAFKKTPSKAYVFVYDSKGEEVSFKEFAPSTRYPLFAFSEAALSNNGDMTMLFISYEKKGKQEVNAFNMPLFNTLFGKAPGDPKNTSLHIATISDGDVTEYRIPHFSFGEIHSAGILQLDNGTCFIGGYYGEEASKPSIGYFSCIFDPNSENIVETRNSMLPEEQKAQDKHMFLIHLKYRIYVQDIVQLANGNVVMLGEHRAYAVQTQRVGNTTFTEFSNWASDVVYQTFDKNGDSQRSDMVRKLQSHTTNAYLPLETFSPLVFCFHDYCLSYSSFVKGNDIYLIYNNSLEHDKYCSTTPLNYGKACMRLTKLSPDGQVDYKTIMKCDTRKSYFQRLWLTDEDGTVYICTNGKQGYGIESFEVKD